MIYPLPQVVSDPRSAMTPQSVNTEEFTDSSALMPSVPEKVLIKQGAEALLYRTTFLLPTLPALLKYRPSKPYRHPVLDAKLTKHRCLSEARLLVRIRSLGLAEVAQSIAEKEAANGNADGTVTCYFKNGQRRERPKPKVQVPSVYFVDETRGEIYMEWIEGSTVRDVLDLLLHPKSTVGDESLGSYEELARQLQPLMTNMGSIISHLHNSLDIVHGDLTTSNIMLRHLQTSVPEPFSAPSIITSGKYDIVLIDFGLGSVSISEEDKAVDLYVLERAFISTHPKAEKLFKDVLSAYAEEGGKKAESVLKRLVEVRMRGRKKSMIG